MLAAGSVGPRCFKSRFSVTFTAPASLSISVVFTVTTGSSARHRGCRPAVPFTSSCSRDTSPHSAAREWRECGAPDRVSPNNAKQGDGAVVAAPPHVVQRYSLGGPQPRVAAGGWSAPQPAEVALPGTANAVLASQGAGPPPVPSATPQGVLRAAPARTVVLLPAAACRPGCWGRCVLIKAKVVVR
ncbi:hypothetical protein E2C01_082274 [Portunus trituberculatus]|uniref:Uncharacterized protein n=1 Tax=Portunus trituberculatus TaxID=210409 RepID=A0A5B7IU38_PORTR|nr:hypothetical protein [Portunus trituberculatus]